MTIKDLIILAFIILVFLTVLHLNGLISNYIPQKNQTIETESETIEIEINHVDSSKIANVAVPVVPVSSVENAEEAIEEFIFIPYTYLPDEYLDGIPLSNEFQTYLYNLCDEYNVSYSLVISLIWRESTFNPDTHNSGCKGLMQINELAQHDRIKDLEVTNLYDPYQNVLVGIDYLVYLFDTYSGNVHYVLMAYNGGEAYADRLYNKGIYSTKYSRWIVDKAYELTNIYGY